MLSSIFKCLKYLRLEGNPNYLQNKILLLLQVFPKFLGLKPIVLPRPCVIFISSKRELIHLPVVHTPALCAHTCLWHTQHTPACNAHSCLWCAHLPVAHTPARGAHTCLQCTNLPMAHTLVPVVFTPARGAHTCPRCTHLPAVHTPARGTHTCLWYICALGHCVKHKAMLRLSASGCVWQYIAVVKGCVRSPSGVCPVLSTLSLSGLKTAGYVRLTVW